MDEQTCRYCKCNPNNKQNITDKYSLMLDK